MPKHWSLVPAAAALAGCIPADEEPATSSTSANICQSMCGDNSPVIDGVPFYGAYLPLAPPSVYGTQPHVLHYATSLGNMLAGNYAPIDVDRGRLRTRVAGNWRYGPANLENGVLLIAIRRRTYFVRIAKVNSGTVGGSDLGEPFWTTMPGDRAETYQLQWADAEAPVNASGAHLFEDVCPDIVPLDDELWQNQIDAVVFEGEKYDLDTANISLTSTNDHVAWFNVACAGSLPAKMYLTRRTSASNLPAYVNTIADDRQAMVRAWAAEYCGNGDRFTETGHKLLIRDHLPNLGQEGWLPQEAPIGFSDLDLKNNKVTIEAVWNDNGAVCLDTPRLAVPDPNVPPVEDIEDQIIASCGKLPDPCTGQPWFPHKWTEHGKFLTATKPWP